MGQQAQITCSLARQIAKCPNYQAQSGQLLNAILSELCQNYDFDVARTIYNFSFNDGGYSGSGPYPLPADYLRMDVNDCFYTINGVKYSMISVDLAQFDLMVQTEGFQSYPTNFATNMSVSPPTLYAWPPASGAYPVTMRYFRQMPDITTPETSSEIPWFPNDNYLLTRLAGELMKITNDDRWQIFLGDTESGAQGILQRYLKLKDDKNNRSETVRLDRRRFGSRFNDLRNTKTIGW